MIGELAQLLLVLALLAAAVQAWAGLGPRPQLRLAGLATLWQTAAIAGATALLARAFVLDDFSLNYVTQHGHSSLPLLYKISAVWGGHEGSMLLWCLALALWSLAALRGLARHDGDYAARTLGLLGLVAAAVLGFVLFTSNPFERLLPPPEEGMSLNPLLQDPGMALHPPLLYLGYVGAALPFAMSLAALLAPPPAGWLRWMRPYAAVALAFLSLGIGLGSWWAYYELGWGGWWFWDPVENASLMPWLALAALIHMLPAREQQGRFPVWTAWLAITAFVLALLGTFLVRSGVLTSVHAFASDPRRGSVMLALIAAALLGSLALQARHGERWLPARSAPPAALLSRDSALAGAQLLLQVACACVLLGTLYPLAMDALRLGKLSVGAPYFDTVMAPLLLPLLGLLIPAAWLRWRGGQSGDGGRALLRRLRPTLVLLALAAPLLALGLWQVWGQVKPWVFLSLLLASGVAASTLHHGWQRLHAGGASAGLAGMVCAHLGVAVFAVGVAMVKGHGIERDVRLAPGDSHRIADCQLRFERMDPVQGSNYRGLAGQFSLACEGRPAQTLVSEKRSYVGSGMPMTESAIAWGLSRDLYIALGSALDESQPQGAWSVRVQLKPFVRWIWAGVALMALGGFAAAASARLRRASRRRVGISAQPVA